MKLVLAVTVASAIALSSGCGTPYKEQGFMGGVTASKITSDTYRITSRGNAYTSRTTVEDYTLLKAAETTLEVGGTHFAVMGNRDATRVSQGTTPTQTQFVNTGGGSVTAYTSGGDTYTMRKPGEDAIIKILRVPDGVQAPYGTYNAREVFESINPRVSRPQSG